MDFQAILWVGVAAALVSAIVSSLLYKTKVKDKTLNGRYAASKILSELQDKFFRDGSDDWWTYTNSASNLGFLRRKSVPRYPSLKKASKWTSSFSPKDT
jgi:hypothetical protein